MESLLKISNDDYIDIASLVQIFSYEGSEDDDLINVMLLTHFFCKQPQFSIVDAPIALLRTKSCNPTRRAFLTRKLFTNI